ncbi:BlaI/MecI/CopY family transcriptional regulator [Aminipila butyrica]|uniref:BlaI/MecI/CopY family transcriptional regulator n=1 Tax=Aminipila butyrica TaxID=433296 RepID=A0A858C1C8_9FIRM|nr:BlaI/MecI/CopY family transcriptional regulator [Aminipila butyrica]QIB70306.1 BlaI/MecI/CopY family transcriptional regulator [Aminipila butyrica]
MNSTSFTLTKNEQEIMELLWSENQPLSRSQIIELSTERTWKASSIHILLNQLLKKGAIKVDGFVKTGKNYGRTFSAAVTPEEYQIIHFKSSKSYLHSKSAAIVNLVSSLVEEEDMDAETLSRLEAILEAKKESKRK